MMDRKSAARRGYNARWAKVRQLHLENNPLCVMHLANGVIVGAQVVDHIRPHKGDYALFWDFANLQSLCKACHDKHKQSFERTGYTHDVDDTGWPTHRNHPANQHGRQHRR